MVGICAVSAMAFRWLSAALLSSACASIAPSHDTTVRSDAMGCADAGRPRRMSMSASGTARRAARSALNAASSSAPGKRSFHNRYVASSNVTACAMSWMSNPRNDSSGTDPSMNAMLDSKASTPSSPEMTCWLASVMITLARAFGR